MRLVYLLLLTLLFPTAVFAQPYRTVSYDASGRKVITYTCDPNETPEWFKENYLKEEKAKEPIIPNKDRSSSEQKRKRPRRGVFLRKLKRWMPMGKKFLQRITVSDMQDSVLGMQEDDSVK